METLLEALSNYASEVIVPRILLTKQYHNDRLLVAQHWEDFFATLTEAQREALEAVQDEDFRSRETMDLALFRAGISIGMELSGF